MMKLPTDLSLDCKPSVCSMLLKSCGELATEQTENLEEFVARLEEETLKIDAFKRELPLCMQLLTSAMESSRQELQSRRTNQGLRPVLEEFIPLKTTTLSENAANISADKTDWIASARLWNQEIEGTNPSHSPLVTSDPILALNSQPSIHGRGAFRPFSSKGRVSSFPGAAFSELTLAPSHEGEIEDRKYSLDTDSGRESSDNHSVVKKEQVCGAANYTRQAQRKARRCWSPDLHRRFVNALHMLGGSQVATPKQIRELMKVDGLTNDEVKSHLQKYRLHTRSPGPGPQLVVVGGIWVPPEYAAAAACGGAPAAALYGTHPANTSFLFHRTISTTTYPSCSSTTTSYPV